EEALVERLAPVADAPELLLRPRGLEELAVARELRRREVPRRERVRDRLRREHARADREVDALQGRRVQEPRGVSDEHVALAEEARHREVAALGDGLRAVAKHLAAREEARDRGMLLPLDEEGVRIEPRVV